MLDISNNYEYIWTNNFDLSAPPSSPPTPPPSSPVTKTLIQSTTIIQLTTVLQSITSNVVPAESVSEVPQSSSTQSSSNKPAMIGAIIGSLFGGILLSFGGFYLYKLNKDKQKQKHGIPIPGDDNYSNHSQEEMLIYSS